MNDKPDRNPVNNYAKYSGMALQMIVCIGLFSIGGNHLDKHFETNTPYWTAALSLLGVGIGLYLVFKQLPKAE